jgi:hypothetical protein
MTTKEVDRSITELAEDAAELAARAVGCGLARLIDTYVPPRLAGRFAMRVAVVLLREVRALDAAPAAVPSPGTH